jgi:hypothetical protein
MQFPNRTLLNGLLMPLNRVDGDRVLGKRLQLLAAATMGANRLDGYDQELPSDGERRMKLPDCSIKFLTYCKTLC